jgi:hypothetical protein
VARPKGRPAHEPAIAPHWKIRLGIRNVGVIYLASETEPTWVNQKLIWTPIEEPNYGDTVGYIDWAQVAFATWRYNFGTVEEPG